MRTATRPTLIHVFVLVALAAACGGCYLPAAPRLSVEGPEVRSASPDGELLTFTLVAENEGERELPLMDVSYRVRAVGPDGRRELFRGRRSAQASVPRGGVSRVELPVPVAAEMAVEEDERVEVRGTVSYRKAGRLPRTLARLGVYRWSGFRSGYAESDEPANQGPADDAGE